MKRTKLAVMALSAAAIIMPAAASAAPSGDVMLAMASYAGAAAGPDAAAHATAKKAPYAARPKVRAKCKGDCKDKADRADCADCVACAECGDCAEDVAAKAAEKAGICDPTTHGAAQAKAAAGA